METGDSNWGDALLLEEGCREVDSRECEMDGRRGIDMTCEVGVADGYRLMVLCR